MTARLISSCTQKARQPLCPLLTDKPRAVNDRDTLIVMADVWQRERSYLCVMPIHPSCEIQKHPRRVLCLLLPCVFFMSGDVPKLRA